MGVSPARIRASFEEQRRWGERRSHDQLLGNPPPLLLLLPSLSYTHSRAMKEARYRANRSPMAHRDTAANRARGESRRERKRERKKEISGRDKLWPSGGWVCGVRETHRGAHRPHCAPASACLMRARACALRTFHPYYSHTRARLFPLSLRPVLSFHARARLLVRFQASSLSFLSLVLLGPPYPLLQREERDRDVSST